MLGLLMALSLTFGQSVASNPGNTPTEGDASTVVDRTTGTVVSVAAGGTVTIEAKNGLLIKATVPANGTELAVGDKVSYALAWINGEAVASGLRMELPVDALPLEDGEEEDEEEDDCNCSTYKSQSLAASTDYCAKRQTAIDAQAAVDAHKQKDDDLTDALAAAEIAYALAEAAGASDHILQNLGLVILGLQWQIDTNLEAWLDANDALTAALQAEATAKANAITLHAAWKQCCAGQTADSCPGCPESADPLACP